MGEHASTSTNQKMSIMLKMKIFISFAIYPME